MFTPKVNILMKVTGKIGCCKSKTNCKMKYLIIILLLSGCLSNEKPIPKLREDIKLISVDSLWKNSKIDSAVYYFTKETDCSLESSNYTRKYIETGNEKYRRLARKYGDSVHYYYLLLKATSK